MPSLHVLVVEDNPDVNRALTVLLERRGHTVTRAGTVRDALEAGQTNPIDLVILDIGLPDGDGWNLFAALRRDLPNLKAIALTGYGFEADRIKSASAGIFAHLTKPVDIAALEKEIARVVVAGSETKAAMDSGI